MCVTKAASGLVREKRWSCDAKAIKMEAQWLGLPGIVCPNPMTQPNFSSGNQSSVALERTLQSKDGMNGKPITLLIVTNVEPMSIGRTHFGPKPGCHDASVETRQFVDTQHLRGICVHTTKVGWMTFWTLSGISKTYICYSVSVSFGLCQAYRKHLL